MIVTDQHKDGEVLQGMSDPYPPSKDLHSERINEPLQPSLNGSRIGVRAVFVEPSRIVPQMIARVGCNSSPGLPSI